MFSRWWWQLQMTFFRIFTPKNPGEDLPTHPIWRLTASFFQKGLVETQRNHQPVTLAQFPKTWSRLATKKGVSISGDVYSCPSGARVDSSRQIHHRFVSGGYRYWWTKNFPGNTFTVKPHLSKWTVESNRKMEVAFFFFEDVFCIS